MMESRLCVREVPEGEAEFRYYLNAYNAPRRRENRAMGLLHVPGREIPATVIAKRASEIRRALSGGEILGIPYLAGSQIRYRTTLDAVLQWDHARRNPLQAVSHA